MSDRPIFDVDSVYRTEAAEFERVRKLEAEVEHLRRVEQAARELIQLHRQVVDGLASLRAPSEQLRDDMVFATRALEAALAEVPESREGDK